MTAWNEILPLARAGVDTMPHDENTPYYVAASDGLFLHRNSLLGWALVPAPTMPTTLPALGSKGTFTWRAPKIPAALFAQITDFFRRIYTAHGTEAEVILTMHADTLEWGVYIPTQKTTGTSVNSVYEPTDIVSPWRVVGTIHSHCMMPAFHSGIDHADAAKMDGVHLTIGMVNNPVPEVVAMVTMNTVTFDMTPSDVADINFADIELAPLEWDAKVIPTIAAITKSTTALFNKWAPKHTPTHWDPSASYGLRYTSLAAQWDNWDTGYPHGYHEPTWAAGIGQALYAAINDSDAISNEDLRAAERHTHLAKHPEYWRDLLADRLADTQALLALATRASHTAPKA